jgi:HK97 family phage prohead protease
MRHTKAFVEKRQDGSLRILASDDSVDRDGERIDKGAWKRLDGFTKNPVLLQQHQWQEPPIGKIEGLSVTEKGLEGTVKFARTPVGQEYKSLYEDGIMSAFSVGFVPHEKRIDDVDGKEILTWTDVELLEISAVSIPSNANALVQRAAKKGDDEEDDLPAWNDTEGWDELERELNREDMEEIVDEAAQTWQEIEETAKKLQMTQKQIADLRQQYSMGELYDADRADRREELQRQGVPAARIEDELNTATPPVEWRVGYTPEELNR